MYVLCSIQHRHSTDVVQYKKYAAVYINFVQYQFTLQVETLLNVTSTFLWVLVLFNINSVLFVD